MSVAQTNPPPAAARPVAASFTMWTWSALGISVAGVLGSLYLSLDMGLKACPLCFYQRVFVMAVAGVMLAGWMSGSLPGPTLSYLSMPLAAGGLVVSVFHNFLEISGTLECPRGMIGLGSAPQQAMLMFVVLVAALVADIWQFSRRLLAPAIACVVLGGALAFGAIRSVPSSVAPDYTKPVDQDGCRKVLPKA